MGSRLGRLLLGLGTIFGIIVGIAVGAILDLPHLTAAPAGARGLASARYRIYLPIEPNLPPGPLDLGLTPSPASGPPVGTTVTWTATATDAVPVEYRFSVALEGQAPVVARDFAASPRFTWTPLAEGTYTVQVAVQEVPPSPNPVRALTSAPFVITSRVPSRSTRPVVSPTSHPLVALYSIPPCGTGTVAVQYGVSLAQGGVQTTPSLACSPSKSTNVYLVGMRPRATYQIQARVTTGATTTLLPPDVFTTGALPPTLPPFPTISAPVPAGASASTQDAVVFHSALSSGTSATQTQMYATDLAGNVLWYYAPNDIPGQPVFDHPLPGGDVLVVLGNQGPGQVLRRIDPLGDPVQETSVGRIDEQLAAMAPAPGRSIDPILGFHHEENVLPNGHVVVLGYIQRTFPPGTQGSTTGQPVTILTDEIVDLDANFQVDWTWDAFDYLDVGHRAVLNEICPPSGQGGCTFPGDNDWTHSNAVIYSAADHDLLLSVRHQDWVLKIDYADGAGDGHIMWRLGNGGDFALTNPAAGESFPWFSHQHGIQLYPGDLLVVFDNGNTRCAVASICSSRGQVYQLDEGRRQATLVLNVALGNYSSALGFAQRLQNGDYVFTSGFQGGTNPPAQNEEFDPRGTSLTYELQDQPEWLYRDYRMPTLYSGCCGD